MFSLPKLDCIVMQIGPFNAPFNGFPSLKIANVRKLAYCTSLILINWLTAEAAMINGLPGEAAVFPHEISCQSTHSDRQYNPVYTGLKIRYSASDLIEGASGYLTLKVNYKKKTSKHL